MFLQTGKDANDGDKQLYTLKNKYESGKLNTLLFKNLSQAFLRTGDDATASDISAEFIKALSKKQLRKKENMDHILSLAPYDTDGATLNALVNDKKCFVKKYGKGKSHGYFGFRCKR